MRFTTTLLAMLLMVSTVVLADDPHGTPVEGEHATERPPRPLAVNEEAQEFAFEVSQELAKELKVDPATTEFRDLQQAMAGHIKTPPTTEVQ